MSGFSKSIDSSGNLVMLDEPSSALDPKSESDFNELVLHSMKQKTLNSYNDYELSSCSRLWFKSRQLYE